MAYYYTSAEGGDIKQLPIFTSFQKLVKLLRKNRKKVPFARYSNLRRKSLVEKSQTHDISYRIHTLFIVNNGKIKQIWDSEFNGYRKHFNRQAKKEWSSKLN